ncbi:unnamed protein product [Umbelopsis ramanniana]
MILLADIPQYLNQTITTLEHYSEPEAWIKIIGPRLFAMLTRYLNNDVVLVGFGVYAYTMLYEVYQAMYQAAWNWLFTLFYATIMIEHGDPIFGCVSEFLSEKTSQLPRLSEAVARAQWEGDESDDENIANPQRPSVVLGPPLGQVNTITYKGYRLEVSRYKSSDTGSSYDDMFNRFLPQTEYISVRIRFGSMATLKGILEEWKDMYYDKKFGKCIVYRYLLQPWGHQWEWDASIVKVPRRFETVVMKEGQKETLLKDIKSFLSQGEWFQKRGIPYRRGYLLYGPPGTGKTSTIEAIAGELHMNVSIISLNNDLDDNRFLSCLQHKPRNSILLIEDVDSIKMSTNDEPHDATKSPSGGISLSSLLNALDGIVGQEGSVVFMTCNDTSKLPPALLRPGRIDMKLHMGLADEFQIRHMYRRFFDESGSYDLERLIKLLPKEEIAPAELQNFFMMYSLQNETKNICDGVNDFLEEVRKDREQARRHAERMKQKRDIYGNLSSDGTPPPTPTSDDEVQNIKKIVLKVAENGHLCLAPS